VARDPPEPNHDPMSVDHDHDGDIAPAGAINCL
jgi:hypothetical protein